MLTPPYSPTNHRLIEASSFREISKAAPFWFGNLAHLYLEIRLNLDELEGAESTRKAEQAHGYIRKGAGIPEILEQLRDVLEWRRSSES